TASVLEPISVYSALILHEDEVMAAEDNNKAEAKKNLKSLMITWALVFLTKPLW
uniref:Uncharacterized protein n=1 Tax=Bos indicus x Bos taurus TaxID=30522 RepID=A0A4W2G864_BOBOX